MTSEVNRYPIRLGGPVFEEYNDDPDIWIRAHKKLGYSAAYCPVDADADPRLIRLFSEKAKKADLLIAEVGAWSNPISPDDQTQKKAFEHCCRQLQLAEEIDAVCCVNIAGSRNPEKWDAPHSENLSRDTFDLIVEVTRKIIDTVAPTRTFFTLEPMPWIFPHSIESYERLLKAINRNAFGVHLDPVNMTNSADRYHFNADFLREAFLKLGPYIKSCHAKDTLLRPELTLHIDEVQPGLGALDYSVFLKELCRLKDVPLMLEHLEKPEEYLSAAAYVRQVGRENGLTFAKL